MEHEGTRIDRPHIEFVQQQALPWVEAERPRALEGFDVKVLSEAPEGSGTYLTRLPGASGTLPVEERARLQLFVVDGELEVDGERVGELDLLHLPPSARARRWSSTDGATVLAFVDVLDSTGPDDDVVAVRTSDVAWRGAVDDHFAPGAARKDVWMDDVTGEELFLLGTLPLRDNTRAQVHPVVEEVLVVSGELIGEYGVLTAGAYFWRPAGLWHGPFGQRAGTLLLIRSVGGPLTKEYRDYDEVVPQEPAYAPVLPEGYERVLDGSRPYARLTAFGGVGSTATVVA